MTLDRQLSTAYMGCADDATSSHRARETSAKAACSPIRWAHHDAANIGRTDIAMASKCRIGTRIGLPQLKLNAETCWSCAISILRRKFDGSGHSG